MITALLSYKSFFLEKNHIFSEFLFKLTYNGRIERWSKLMSAKKDESLEKLDSASKRLKYIMEDLGVKQSRMAEKLGVSPSGLHYILNNEVKFSKNAKKIAEFLNVNEDWLTSGEGDIYNENTTIKTYKIPVYYPDQLKLFYKMQQKAEINTNDFLITTTHYENKILGIYVTDSEFAPKFEMGDMVAFEQTDSFKEGEFLLVYLAQTNNIVIRRGIHIEQNIFLLSATDNHINKLLLDQGDLIIGTYRECLKKSITT